MALFNKCVMFTLFNIGCFTGKYLASLVLNMCYCNTLYKYTSSPYLYLCTYIYTYIHIYVYKWADSKHTYIGIIFSIILLLIFAVRTYID